MQLLWVRPARATIDYELVILVATVGGAIGAAGWLWLGLPWPRCEFLALTGHPCITCGATRAALQLAHGHLAAAFLFNPLMTFGYFAIALFDLYGLAVLLGGAPRLRVVRLSPGEKVALRFGAVALLALNWSYLLFFT